MTQKQQQTILVGVLVALAVLGAAYFFAIKPQLAQRAENKDATSSAEQQTQTLESDLVSLQAKEKALPDAEKEMGILTSKFPNNYQQDKWFRMILNVGNAAGVEIANIAPSEPVAPTVTANGQTAPAPPAAAAPTPGAPAVTDDLLIAQSNVTVIARGTVAQIQKFVAALEQMERPLLIDAVQFSDDGSESTVTITGKTFLSRGLQAPSQNAEAAPPVAQAP